MKSLKWKILFPVIIITILVGTKYVLWDFPVSSGKRVGNLTKISKKGKFISTWEGTIDEGSGDKLTSYFSVRNNDLGEELYNYEGKQVILYYDQYLMGWPRDTKYNVTSWKPKDVAASISVGEVDDSRNQNEALSLLSRTLFCSLLGTLFENQELYQQVKSHVKEKNLFLYRQFSACNE